MNGLRQMNFTRQRTKLIILFIICFNVLHRIPIDVYYDVSNTDEWDFNSVLYLYDSLTWINYSCFFFTVFGILIFK